MCFRTLGAAAAALDLSLVPEQNVRIHQVVAQNFSDTVNTAKNTEWDLHCSNLLLFGAAWSLGSNYQAVGYLDSFTLVAWW